MELLSSRQARKEHGDVTRSTWWKWDKIYPDFPKAAIICGRKYYDRAELDDFMKARFQDQIDPDKVHQLQEHRESYQGAHGNAPRTRKSQSCSIELASPDQKGGCHG